MTQDRCDSSSFDKKIDTFEDSRSLKVTEEKFMKMIKSYDWGLTDDWE